MYIYTYTYMYVCMYIYIYIYIHIHIYNRLIMIYPLLSPLWLVNRLTIWGFLYLGGYPNSWMVYNGNCFPRISRGELGFRLCCGGFPSDPSEEAMGKSWLNWGDNIIYIYILYTIFVHNNYVYTIIVAWWFGTCLRLFKFPS